MPFALNELEFNSIEAIIDFENCPLEQVFFKKKGLIKKLIWYKINAITEIYGYINLFTFKKKF